MMVGAFGFNYLPADSMIGRISHDIVPISEKRIEAIESRECEMMTTAFEKAKAIISENKPLIEAIYKELKQKEKLSKREVEIILNKFKEREENKANN